MVQAIALRQEATSHWLAAGLNSKVERAQTLQLSLPLQGGRACVRIRTKCDIARRTRHC